MTRHLQQNLNFRNVLIVLAGFLALTVNLTIASTEISCEKIEQGNDVKLCYLDKTTSINSNDTTIATKDDSVKGIFMQYNEKIRYLPVGVHKKFSKLEKYFAAECSIQAISKENFEKLTKLQEIWLTTNEITKVKSDTFQGLSSLKIVKLGEFDYSRTNRNARMIYLPKGYNQIKFLNGATFAGLPALQTVLLTSNDCIDDTFKTKDQIKGLTKKLNEKCGFKEN